MRIAFVIVLALGMCELAESQGRRFGSYQLKYKPIPPKAKKEEAKPTAKPIDEDQRIVNRIKRQPISGNTTQPLTRHEFQEQADWKASQQQKAADAKAAKRQAWEDARAQERAAEMRAYNAWAAREKQLAESYDEARARAMAQGEVQLEVNRRTLMMDAELRAMEGPQVYVVPVSPRTYPAAPGYGREALKQGYYDSYYDSLYWTGYGW